MTEVKREENELPPNPHPVQVLSRHVGRVNTWNPDPAGCYTLLQLLLCQRCCCHSSCQYTCRCWCGCQQAYRVVAAAVVPFPCSGHTPSTAHKSCKLCSSSSCPSLKQVSQLLSVTRYNRCVRWRVLSPDQPLARDRGLRKSILQVACDCWRIRGINWRSTFK